MEIEWFNALLLVGAGLIAGFINTLAGSGSFITLALMVFLQVPIDIANASNRVGVLLQNIVATDTFRRKGLLDGRGGLIVSIPAVLGSFCGAAIASDLDKALLEKLFAVLMLLMVLLMFINPKKWLQGSLETLTTRPSWQQIGLLFGIGVYGGFIQAGVGIFLLGVLVLGIGYNLVRANAIKNLVVLFLTVAALLVFIINGQVDWQLGLLLAVGNIVGSWIAVRLAIKQGAGFVRWVVIVVVTFSALQLLGVFEWVGQLF